MSRRVLLLVCLSVLTALPSAAAAQTVQPPAPKNDSLWNGVLIGAGVGAVSGVLAGRSAVECSERAGFNVPLTFGVLGAGLGAGIGAAIDAAFHARSSTRRAPSRNTHVTVAPVVGKKAQGMVASIRF